MRRPSVALAGLAPLASALVTGVGEAAGGAGASAAGTARTLLGPGALDGPGGIALSAAGNLFVADTGPAASWWSRPALVSSTASASGPGRPPRSPAAAARGAGALGHASDVAVDSHGDAFIAEATAQRVQELRTGSHTVVTVAGTGTGGFNGDGRDATAGELDEPTGVAVDAAGDHFIADTANCRVRVVPAVTGALFG